MTAHDLLKFYRREWLRCRIGEIVAALLSAPIAVLGGLYLFIGDKAFAVILFAFALVYIAVSAVCHISANFWREVTENERMICGG